MFELFPGYNATPMTGLAMQLPMWGHGAPYAPDWNNDGVLDLWHHNHYEFSRVERRWSTAAIGKKGKRPGGCMADWDSVLRDGDRGTYKNINNGKGFILWSDAREFQYCIDAHSSAFLDIDGDGYKDLFVVTGGGRGKGNSFESDNMLFWGVPDNSPLGYRLDGGVEAANAAGLDGRRLSGNERGRHMYFLDVDGDGLLDVFFLSNERADDAVVPGNLYQNMGNRRFKIIKSQETGFTEFASSALLSDVDGDGFAHEVIVVSECDSHDRSSRQPDSFPCRRSPRGSINVYRRDSSDLLMVLVSTTPPRWKDDKVAKSIATGDWDFDGRPDIAILWKHRVSFYLSLRRRQRCRSTSSIGPERRKCLLTLDQPDMVVNVANCGFLGSANFRFADFNLNGRIDMLVVCQDPSKHTIYELSSRGQWTEMKNGNKIDFGALNSPSLPLGGKDFCKDIPVIEGKLSHKNETCHKIFDKTTCRNVRYSKQFLICSRRAQRPNEPGAYALGATVADIDNDGYVVIILGHRYGSAVILRNNFREQGLRRFFTVRLDRTAGDAASIGAIVKVTTSRMGPFSNETTTQTRVISTLSHETDSNGGHKDRLIFGLGERGSVEKLVVKWPNCCERTVILAEQGKFQNWYNSMLRPYEVPLPTRCDKSCSRF